MKCVICGKTIRNRDPHCYVTVPHTTGVRRRKIVACIGCGGRFDKWVDRYVDPDNGQISRTAAGITPREPKG